MTGDENKHLKAKGQGGQGGGGSFAATTTTTTRRVLRLRPGQPFRWSYAAAAAENTTSSRTSHKPGHDENDYSEHDYYRSPSSAPVKKRLRLFSAGLVTDEAGVAQGGGCELTRSRVVMMMMMMIGIVCMSFMSSGGKAGANAVVCFASLLPHPNSNVCNVFE